MSTISQLNADLSALLNESKRRNSDIRQGCEAALESISKQSSIDNLPDTTKSKILSPALISCNTNNPRFVNLSIPIIHKLIISNGVNIIDLSALLKALLEASHLAIDIQLKILQCLPSLMQIYNNHITGDLLLNLLVICSSLTSNNKSTVVINTASATLQQIFNYIYERMPEKLDSTLEDGIVVKIEDSEVKLDPLSYEGYAVFSDLCKMIDNDTVAYLKNVSIKLPAILEIIESVLHNANLFSNHVELNHLIRVKLIPLVLRIVNADEEFPLVIRSLRILLLLLSTQLNHLVIEGEIILSILNHLLLDNPNYTSMVLEVFKSLNFHTVKSIYELYDSNPKKKNVTYELFSILSTYLQYNESIRRETLQVPTGQQVYLSSKYSTIKINVLDLLDKQELPVLPETYPIHLILHILTSFTDGIAKFVYSLSNENLENELEFVNNLIKLVYPQVYSIFKCFLYSLMDTDNFHSLIRSLQKFTHTTGLLGLNDLRDGLLELLATVVITDAFNSRHVTCLRALINLAISLGSTLTESWRIIWTALQWSDFLINGPNEFSNYKLEFYPSLSTGEVTNITNSMKKFYDSIEEYPAESYNNLVESLIKMYQLQDKQEQEESKEDSDTEKLRLCPYNKIYFIKKLFEVSKRNGVKFPDTFKKVSQFYITTGVKNHNLNFRKYVIGQYNAIIKSLALSNLNEDQQSSNATDELCLEGLNDLVTELNLNDTTELLILNNQFEIHQIILDTLTELLENYKSTNDQSWFIIFQIINNPFKYQNSDKITSLLNSSFNCLKIILNEFIVNLPPNIYKVLIDTLFNFCVQTTDLNISFSSISYFWLIGDSIKKLQEQDAKSSSSTEIKNEEELIKSIEDNVDFKGLDIYLLLNLIKLAGDSRDQVRNGAIQTFFEIIDIHGQAFDGTDWRLTYDIILKKIFEINSHEETVKLKFDGFINLFSKFNNHFEIKVWESFFDYMQQLIALNQLKINIILLEKFNDLLLLPVNKEVVDLLFKFWIEFPIEYNFVDPELFIDTLVTLNKSFPSLYRKLDTISESDLNRIFNLLTKCLMYPIISRLDDKTPTPLQQTVFDNISNIDLKNNDPLNCILIRELSNTLIFQYKVREKIENKLTNLKMKFKLPTFISVSNLSFDLLEKVFSRIESFDSLIDTNTIIRLMRSLLNVIENKSVGVDASQPLWEKCNVFFTTLVENLVQHQFSTEIWTLILDAVKMYYKYPDYEAKNVEQFQRIASLILPHMKDPQIIEAFLSEMYQNSYLYEKNEIELELMSDDINLTITSLINYPFEESFGSTAPIKFYKVNQMKLICLERLIGFTVQDNTFQQSAVKFFMLRLSFTLRRLIEQALLSYKLPVSAIQINELKMLLSGLLNYLKLNEDPKVDMGIIKLLVKVVGLNSEANSIIEAILLQLNKL